MPPIRGCSTPSTPGPSTPPSAPPQHIRRPPNAFIIFRRAMYSSLLPPKPGQPRKSQGELSREFSTLWRNLTPAERAVWDKLAAEKDAEHKAAYPNYKYQPKKKEEKDRLAEEKKAERKRAIAARKQSRHRSTSSSTPVATNNTPQIIAPHPTRYEPYYIPAIPHYTTVPFVGNMDLTAPSPPMSAASTPGPDSSHHTLEASSTPAVQSGSSVPPTSLPPVLLNGASIPLPFVVARPPAQLTESSDYIAPTNTNAGDWNLSSTVLQDPNWNQTAEVTEQSLYFDVSQADTNQVNTWLNGHGASLEEQFPQPQVDFDQVHAYQLERFNLDSAVSDLNGELNVRVGELPLLEEIPNYFPADLIPDVPANDFYDQYQAESSFSGLYTDSDLAQYFDLRLVAEDPSISFLYPSTDLNAALSAALQPVENAVASSSSTQPYVPPSGAANSGNRRVAASYRKDSLYSLDRSSPLPA